jgi:signal transduction histidine kinase
MIADLFTLTAIVYLTGSIESPLLFFFVLHMIVGSLILPDYLIYSFAVLLIIGFWTITVGEFYAIIPNFHLSGYIPNDLHRELSYVLGVNISFALVIILIVIISNRMANQLYIREQQLLQSIDKINAAEKEKQKYISGVVHEIRTPLSAVQAYLDLVLQKFLGPLDEVVEQKLIRARKRSEEAIELANDVLKISKLHSENSFVMEEIDIPDILDTVIKRAKVNAEAKGVELYLGSRVREKHIFQGDPLLIQIALSNIIANSIKYNSVDGIVEIDVVDDNDNLIIVVADNGLGIPVDELDKIYTDFFRASNIKRAGLEGSGLGLSVVKQIVERHGGTIKIQSPSDLATDKYPGTEVKITFPFVKR